MLKNKLMVRSEATRSFLKGILVPNKSWYVALLLIFCGFSSTSEANTTPGATPASLEETIALQTTPSLVEKTDTQELTQNLKGSILSASLAQSSFEEATLDLEQAQYKIALQKFKLIEQSGFYSGGLFLNMAIAAVELDSLGLAKFYLQKAVGEPTTEAAAIEALAYVESQFSRQAATLPPLPWRPRHHHQAHSSRAPTLARWTPSPPGRRPSWLMRKRSCVVSTWSAKRSFECGPKEGADGEAPSTCCCGISMLAQAQTVAYTCTHDNNIHVYAHAAATARLPGPCPARLRARVRCDRCLDRTSPAPPRPPLRGVTSGRRRGREWPTERTAQRAARATTTETGRRRRHRPLTRDIRTSRRMRARRCRSWQTGYRRNRRGRGRWRRGRGPHRRPSSRRDLAARGQHSS